MLGHFGSPDNRTIAVELDPQVYPKEIEVRIGNELKKFPVAYLKKTVLKVGKWIHPATKEAFELTPSFLDKQRDTTNAMIAAGIEIPTPLDHKDEHVAHTRNPYFVKAIDNVGFVVKAVREGDELNFIQAAVGEDAALTAIRNRSSVYIKPWTDSTGKDWGTCIVHSAYTPIPVLTGLGPPASLSREEPVLIELAREEGRSTMKLSEAQRKRLIAIAILNSVKKEDAERMDDAALQDEGVKYLEKLPGDVDYSTVKTELDKAKTDLAAAKTELTTTQSRETELKAQLAREKPEAPNARMVKMTTETVYAKVDAKVAGKKFSPAVGDFIKSKMKAEPIALALAREDDKPELYETMIELAEMSAGSAMPGTATQVKEKQLSRETPKEGDDDNKTEHEKRIDSAKKIGAQHLKGRQYATPGAKK